MFTKIKKADAERRRFSEGSFTLVETVIALSMIAFVIVEIASVQGNSIVISDYGRNATQASFLAQRVMSQVEYFYKSKPFPELETKTPIVDQKFEDTDEYTYSLEIKEWKFPFLQLLSSTLGGGGGDDEDKDEDSSGGMGKMLETVMNQVFGKEPIFMTAHVDVNWSEGAARNSVGLTYLLTNQAKLDEAIIALRPTYDALTKPKPKKGDDKKNKNLDENGNPITGATPQPPPEQ